MQDMMTPSSLKAASRAVWSGMDAAKGMTSYHVRIHPSLGIAYLGQVHSVVQR